MSMAMHRHGWDPTDMDEKRDRVEGAKGILSMAWAGVNLSGSITGRRLQPRRTSTPGTYEAKALRRITCLSNPKVAFTALLITFVIVPCRAEQRLPTHDVWIFGRWLHLSFVVPRNCDPTKTTSRQTTNGIQNDCTVPGP